MNLGINLCFAVKRYLEPESWAQFVAEDLGLSTVQFTFDLLDPWWPERERDSLIQGVVKAADAFRLDIASAQVGLGHYLPGGLLDPSRDARAVAAAWWRRACDVAGALGASAIGGPLGTLSVADGASREARARRYDELLQAVTAITEHARAAGLRRLLIEPTPIAREIPSTIYQSQQLVTDLAATAVIDVALTLDVGHTVYEPLYGPSATTREWIDALGATIGMVHLDNTDRHGDPHWGWPDERGTIDVADLGADLRTAGLGDVSVILEVYPRFEDDDIQVRALIASSVTHCRAALS
ncbi:MAG: TIM barrel protein [Chloroflexi bacterium]|nr:MAG: TIM barrel protein [Chloroflexota bacterium]